MCLLTYFKWPILLHTLLCYYLLIHFKDIIKCHKLKIISNL